MVARRVATTTGEMVRQLCEACVERCEAKRKHLTTQGADEIQVQTELHETTLDYFVGAVACSRALGIDELTKHLEHVVLTDISRFGYANVPKAALKSNRH